MKIKILNRCVKISRKLIDLPDRRSNKHFSFLILKNRIISVGYNLSFTTHPIAHKYGYRFDTIHSELKCIRNFPLSPSYLEKCTLINIRIMNDGSLGISKPCSKCHQLLRDFNISSVYFTDRNGLFSSIRI